MVGPGRVGPSFSIFIWVGLGQNFSPIFQVKPGPGLANEPRFLVEFDPNPVRPSPCTSLLDPRPPLLLRNAFLFSFLRVTLNLFSILFLDLFYEFGLFYYIKKSSFLTLFMEIGHFKLYLL